MRLPKRLRHYVPPRDSRQAELIDLDPQRKLFEWHPPRAWDDGFEPEPETRHSRSPAETTREMLRLIQARRATLAARAAARAEYHRERAAQRWRSLQRAEADAVYRALQVPNDPKRLN